MHITFKKASFYIIKTRWAVYPYNGSYHSNHYEGILWYLKKQKPDLKYSTISTVLQEDFNSLEEEKLNIADFIIVVDSNMTTTY